MNAIISHGVIPSAATILNEPAILVQSLTITPQRTEGRFKGPNRATQGITETDPVMDFAFQALILDPTGLADGPPGTQLVELANFASPIHGFDPTDGVLIFRDPSVSKDTDNPDSISFTATHFPFLPDPLAATAILDPTGENTEILVTSKPSVWKETT